MVSTITYVGAGTEGTATGGANPTPTYPSGLQAGDTLILDCSASVSSVFSTTAAGSGVFTRRATGTSGGSSPSGAVFFRISDGTESGTRSVNSPGGSTSARIFAYRGVDTTTPFDVADGTFGSSTSVTDYDIGTQTTTMPGTTLHLFVYSNAITGSFAPPASYTELWEAANAANLVEVCHRNAWAGSGATGIRTVVRTGGTRGGGIGIALRPATASFASDGTVAATSAASGSASILAASAGSAPAVTSLAGRASTLHATRGVAAAVSGSPGSAASLLAAGGTVQGVTGTSGWAEWLFIRAHGVADPDRLYSVPTDDRYYDVPAENRIYAVPND